MLPSAGCHLGVYSTRIAIVDYEKIKDSHLSAWYTVSG